MGAVAEQDESVLADAGVSLAELASATADYVRHQSLFRVNLVSNALNEQERGFLKRAGAAGVEEVEQAAFQAILKDSAMDYAKMIASSWTQARVAEFLGVSSSRIRQRTDARTLYALDTPKGRVYPSWQFSENGTTVPGIDEVLPLIAEDAHPIGVQGFFLTPQSDLEVELDGQLVQLNPVNWLLTGHSVAEVQKLAESI